MRLDITALAAAAIGIGLLAGPMTARQDQPPLKALMPAGMVIGAALNQSQSGGTDAAAVDIVTKHFSTISPENLLKWQPVHPALDRYNFDPADRYVAFGQERGLRVIGHTLVWHQQVPNAIFQGPDGARVDRDTLLARLRDHIATVVGRYKGRIFGWDVVNEALNEDGTLRDSPWRQIIGDDFIARAFELAHEADPNAELYYNDYNLTKAAKRAGAVRIVQDLKKRGLRIDAVGEQGHWGLAAPASADIVSTIDELSAAGVKVNITELDVTVLPGAPSGAAATTTLTPDARAAIDPYTGGLPGEVQQQLARRYADIFRIVLDHRSAMTRITFWGVSDGDSWLNNFPVRGRTNYPLLWDRERKTKPAFDAIVKVLSGK